MHEDDHLDPETLEMTVQYHTSITCPVCLHETTIYIPGWRLAGRTWSYHCMGCMTCWDCREFPHPSDKRDRNTKVPTAFQDFVE